MWKLMKQLSTLLCCLGDLGVALGLKNQGQINSFSERKATSVDMTFPWRLLGQTLGTGRFPNLYFWPWKLVLPVGNSCWCTLYTPISRPCETQCSSYSPWVRMPWVIFQALQEDIATDGHLLSSCCGCWSGWPVFQMKLKSSERDDQPEKHLSPDDQQSSSYAISLCIHVD